MSTSPEQLTSLSLQRSLCAKVSGDEWLGFWPLCQSVSSQTSGIHLWQFCIAVKWQQVEVEKQKGANESTVGGNFGGHRTGNMYAPWVFVDKQMLLTLILDNTAILILYTAGSGQICTNWTEKNMPWTFPEIDGKQTNKAVCHAGFSTISLEKAWENNRITIEFLNWHSRIYIYIYISGPFWTSTHCSKEYGCQVCSLCRGRLQAMFYHTIHVSHGTGLPSAASVSQA